MRRIYIYILLLLENGREPKSRKKLRSEIFLCHSSSNRLKQKNCGSSFEFRAKKKKEEEIIKLIKSCCHFKDLT